MAENLDSKQRQRFMAATNTLTWNDETVAWHERGVEWAAETIAWALSDTQLEFVRLDYPPCGLINDGLAALTDEPSPWDCTVDS